MERIGTIIQKLQEQYHSKMDAQFLLRTAEMLVAELSMQHQHQQVKKRIAVLMPQHFVASEEVELAIDEVKESIISEAVIATTDKDENALEDVSAGVLSVDEFIAPLVKPILQKPTAIFNTEVAAP